MTSNTVDCETETAGELRHVLRVREHTLHSDGTVASGGTDSAPNPHDLFDSALAACKTITALWYAKRKGIPLERVESHVERDDSDERKGVYRLRVRLTFHGPLSDEQRAQIAKAVEACPVHKLMTTTDVQIEQIA